MKIKFAVLSCFAALSGFAATAQAADLDEMLYAQELPMTQPVEIGSGWYLRGDLGYSLQTRGAATSYSIFNPGPPVSYTAGAFRDTSVNSDWSGSLGVGYNFTDYLRGDVTADFTKGTFFGATNSAAPCGGLALTGRCASVDKQGFKQFGIMANAYVDLGTFKGFTPYVGAGAGMTRVRWGTLNSDQRCISVPGNVCTGAATDTSSPGEKSWRFTYALMAGFSYDLSKDLKLDLGYKYSKIKSGDQFGYDAATTAAGATGIQAKDDGFAKHEVRVGLRYSLF